MSLRNEQLTLALNSGDGWIGKETSKEPESSHRLERLLYEVIHDVESYATKPVKPDSVELENIREALQHVLCAQHPIREQDLPKTVIDAWNSVARSTTIEGPTQAEAPATSWWMPDRRYVRSVSESGKVEWRGPRFFSLAQLIDERNQKDDERAQILPELYDYAGHWTAPTSISLRLVAEIATRLNKPELVKIVTTMIKPQKDPQVPSLDDGNAQSWDVISATLANKHYALAKAKKKAVLPSKEQIAKLVLTELTQLHKAASSDQERKKYLTHLKKLPTTASIERRGMNGWNQKESSKA